MRIVGSMAFTLVFLLATEVEMHVTGASKDEDRQAASSKADGNQGPPSHRDMSNVKISQNTGMYQRYESLMKDVRKGESDDELPDGMLLPFAMDPDCVTQGESCMSPPESTIETELVDEQVCVKEEEVASTCSVRQILQDKHWGSDQRILAMRDKLRKSGSGVHQPDNTDIHPFDHKRPPIFLMPGLAATRLVSWKHKACRSYNPLLSDIKFNDNVWLNMKLVLQMGTIAPKCWEECLKLGPNQTDSIDENGCKLRPDEGLDAIASLAPGGLGADLMVGHTNTVFAWLVQWLADNLGYDVSNIIGLPYDWRLSPSVMEKRDGFLSQMRRRIEAAVKANGGLPGILVAHSMGNSVFRYFLQWLNQEMREEAYARYIKQAERRAKRNLQQLQQQSGWFDDLWNSYFGPNPDADSEKDWQFRELAKIEGDEKFVEWLETHIWTYVGLSAPLLGAVNPLRSVISGENMGLPLSDDLARRIELSFGCTNTVNPISTKMAFCDNWKNGKLGNDEDSARPRSDLYCLDSLVREVEESTTEADPWETFPQLKTLLKNRVDWDTDIDMISIIEEVVCENNASSCDPNITNTSISALDAQSGELFRVFSRVWREKGQEMVIKLEQLAESFWASNVPNILNRTWDRPYIKHVIMAYGVDTPTEVGYEYRKKTVKNSKISQAKGYDGVPHLDAVTWEIPGGMLEKQYLDGPRGGLTDAIMKKRGRLELLGNSTLVHSGDGTVPYLSLSWAHTWLLHAIRAQRHTYGKVEGDVLDSVQISYRAEDEMEWRTGNPPSVLVGYSDKRRKDPDTGTTHPHGTRYKPEMVRYHNVGKSRNTGMIYSTTVIEAAGVEHKETTRNYDILAAVFGEILSYMHDDFGLV